ncbi:MAG: response regulator [Candidatus Rokubacteria bacterium]|nr:response regulator [Candidatus Rokubacteria bacterium]
MPSAAATDDVLRQVADAVASVRADGACAIHLLEETTGAWPPVPGACHADLVAPAVVRSADGRWSAPWSPHLDPQAGIFAVAIVARDIVFGVVLLRFEPAASLTDEEREVVELLAAEAALALHMARLNARAWKRQREAEELAWLARALNETLDPAEVGRRIVDSVLLLFDATFSRLRRLQPDGSLRALAWAGTRLDHAEPDNPLPPEAGALAGLVVHTGRPVWSPDVLTDPRLTLSPETRETLERSGERAVLGVPPRAKDTVLGTLTVGDRVGRVWTEREVALTSAFADQAALALENARLFTAEHIARATAEATEEQLRHAQKMEAIGVLAGGIAHDFNNLLTVISGRAQLLADRVGDDEESRHAVDLIQTTADRAAVLVRQLLQFGRRQMLRPALVQPNEVVRNVSSLLHRVIGEDIELVLDLGRGVSPVLADPGQLAQVLMNLAVNARDAMPAGGRLTIGTSNVRVSDTLARRHVGVEPGIYVGVFVADVGHGINETTRARAFEPFFTTKPQGKGTGLGLSTVHGIVRQSGGFIDLDSRPGAGTTFRIYFPPATNEIEEPAGRPAPSVRDVRGTETVLVAEDDDDVRGITCQVLEINGYTVLEASDVEDAVRIAHDHPGPIDLLLADVVMPRMSGPELAEIVRERRPEIAILYVSGYTDDTRVYGARAIEVLPKSFQLADLVRAVRDRLDQRAA